MKEALKQPVATSESLTTKAARLETALINLGQGLKTELAKLNKGIDELAAEVKSLKNHVGI